MLHTRISVLFILLVVNSCITVEIIDRNAMSVDLCPFWNFIPLHKNLSEGDFIEYRISATTNDKLANFTERLLRCFFNKQFDLSCLVFFFS